MGKEMWAFLGASVAIALPLIFNLLKDIGLNLYKQKQERKYISVQLINALDRVTAQCANLAWDSSLRTLPDGSMSFEFDEPSLDLSSIKGDFKYLKADNLYRLQLINLKLIGIRHALNDEDLYWDGPEFDRYFYERQKSFAMLGIFAMDIIKDICKEHHVKHNSWQFDFNPQYLLRKRMAEISRNIINRKYKISKREMKSRHSSC